ncbi:hypothetical protein LOD99_1995 [Oopsacas minuta]|uniref:Uncharacterized protein n=1 Tax=Oopsacas minuta TaxID=111878 RepID=A0AAV7K5B5_9METZ|nr:hypothetical protein LOD99_1995 [Oopsacas minuta]
MEAQSLSEDDLGEDTEEIEIEHTPDITKVIQPENTYSKEVVMKYDELCRISNDLFSRILQLPAYTADSTRWKSLFFQAFSQFDILWQYQQQQRQALDLRRYQIGEIGSRIAHLYMSYYIHTSQIKFLRESFSFYNAILKRDYFDWEVQTEVDVGNLMHKKLRSFSRAIQVSFFLENFSSVQDYLTRLSDIIQKTSSGKGESVPEEYAHVLSEFSSFLSYVCLPIEDDTLLEISPFQTLPAHTPARSDTITFSLGQAVLVGGNTKQSKLIDYTIDHYRMNSLLHRVTREDGIETMITHIHKISTISLIEVLSGISNTLSPHQALLLYISGESTAYSSSYSSIQQTGELHPSYTTNSILLPVHKNSSSIPLQQHDQLFMEDIYPFLRRPLFLLIDCPGFLSQTELSFPDRFHQPFICIMSPPHYPTTIENTMTRGGGLLTLFLSSPLSGLCLICSIQSISTKLAHTALELITQVEDIAFSTLSSLPNLPLSYKQLCTDDTLQYIVKRFLFFWTCIRLHLGFKKDCMPRCYPPIPTILFHSSYLNTELYELFSFLDISDMFMDLSHAIEL